jgi:collagenase-like PrtC family protease
MKRGGVGACFKICQQPWDLYGEEGWREARRFPSRQISRVADIPAYLEAGAHVLKLQGRSLPPGQLAPLVRRFREAVDGTASGSVLAGRPTLPPAWTVIGR